MIIKRVLKRLRAAWPEIHILLRGDGHFSNPEPMQLAQDDPHTDFISGMAGNSVLSKLAAPFLEINRRQQIIRCENAKRTGRLLPDSTRTYHEVEYAARSWPAGSGYSQAGGHDARRKSPLRGDVAGST